MARSSFSCQKVQSTTGRLLQCCGKPSMICCIRSCRTWSSLVAFWIWAIQLWTYGWLVISWIVISKPLMTVFPLGLTLLSASATATLCPGRYLIVMSYGCSFNSSLCNLGGASLRYFKCMFQEADGHCYIQNIYHISSGET